MVSEKFFNDYDINVSRETFYKLKFFHDTLLKWNKVHNLISQTTVEDIWERHFLDSAQNIQYIPLTTQKIVDLGSGAGFPGIVVAIITDIPTTLIEANEKKSFFLQHIKRELTLPLEIISQRIENIDFLNADIITARALDSIEKLLKLSCGHLKTDGKCLFLKGVNADEEIGQAQINWNFLVKKHSSIVKHGGYVLEIEQISKKVF